MNRYRRKHSRVDMRKLSGDVKEKMRESAIRMVHGGMSRIATSDISGVREETVSIWMKKYRAGGPGDLKEAKRGAPKGSGSKLDDEQEQQVQEMMTDRMPDQLKLPYGLWTRKAVVEPVGREYGVTMTDRAMGNYLKKWGFSPQRPAKLAYEQRPAEVKLWLEEEYPAIAQRAGAENGEIHFGDETGVRNNCQHGRSYAPIGKTPVRKSMSKRFSVNMISTVTAWGKVSFMIYDGRMNAGVFIIFMQQLLKWKRKKVFLIVDNLRVHHAKKVKQWAGDNAERIELFYLPSYSPQHNPDEYLNCDLKQGISSRKAPVTATALQNNIKEHMEMLQQMPQRVRSYFQHHMIHYAAA